MNMSVTEPKLDNDKTLLKIRELNASYDASLILKSINMNLVEGTVMALLGRNGVGKTTLLRALMGLMPKAQGFIAVSYTHLTLPTICSV